MNNRWRETPWVLGASVVVLGVVNALYLWAYTTAAPDVFGGVLFNPVDGYTYLAKMREGWRGEWLFTLPYTAEPGAGVFLYTYYLFLGHVARWLSLRLEVVYHAARLASGFFFLLTAYHFIARFVEAPRARCRVWLMFALGSGLGWAVLPFGRLTADVWVAEAIPFLTLFSNAHFPLAWALLLWLMEWTLPGLAAPVTVARLALIALAVTAMAQVQPLALLNLGVVLGGMTVGRLLRLRQWQWPEWQRLLTVSAFSAPWIFYVGWVMQSHPVLAVWNAQNTSPSPAWWDTLLSGGVLLLAAVPGSAFALRRRSAHDQILLFWLGLTVLAVYAPFPLQRRLMLGLWMPLTLLAWTGWREVMAPRLPARGRLLLKSGLALALTLTNALVLIITAAAVARHQSALYLSRGEAYALDWLETHAEGARVLAAPDLSPHIPVHTDARVIYGHPLETVNAAEQKQWVLSFYRDELATLLYLSAQKVDYIVYGPRERALGELPPLPGWRIVFEFVDVAIYGR